MGLAPVAQIKHILKRRRSDDVSVHFFAVIAIGTMIWVAYGISITNWFIVIPNAVGCFFNIATILFVLRFRSAEPHTDNSSTDI